MRQPIALELVYTEVQVLDEQDIRWFESIASLEEAYRQTRKGSYQPKDSSKQEGLKLANEKQYLMVLGGSGAGKTTFCDGLDWKR
jgi:predicted NACHT family NTPase